MKTFHTFKNISTFQNWLREKYDPKKMSGELDYITISKIVYTMHEYDNDGQSITWANKKHNLMIELLTLNRYKNGYADSTLSQNAPRYLRSDISYAQ